MTRMHPGTRPPIALVVLAAAVLTVAGVLPSGAGATDVGGAGAGAAAPPRTDPPPVPIDPDDPRLRDSRIDPFGDAHPAIAGLRPEVRAALQEAAADARARGLEVWVTSGRRSAAYQQELLNEAVRRYGSLSEALRYVATPETSAHVTGDAVDIGPTETADWMVRHGADHGL